MDAEFPNVTRAEPKIIYDEQPIIVGEAPVPSVTEKRNSLFSALDHAAEAIKKEPVRAKDVSITNEKAVTIEDIVEEANTLFEETKLVWQGYKMIEEIGEKGWTKPAKPKVPELNGADMTTLNRLYHRIQKVHHQLAQSYPTVLRHMIQELWYSPKAFTKYLRRIEKHPWKSDAERMDSYSDYFYILYRETRPRIDLNKLRSIKQDYRDRLQKEHDDFQAAFDKYKKEIDADEARYDQKRRDALLRLKERLAAETPTETTSEETPTKETPSQ